MRSDLSLSRRSGGTNSIHERVVTDRLRVRTRVGMNNGALNDFSQNYVILVSVMALNTYHAIPLTNKKYILVDF